MNTKVVITGYGAVSSVGMGVEAYWQSLLEGKNNIKPIQAFDSSLYRSPLGSEPDWEKVDAKLAEIDCLSVEEEATKLSILATHEAFQMANINLASSDEIDTTRVGCIVGTLCSSSRQQERMWKENATSKEYNDGAEDSMIISYQADALAKYFLIEGPTSLISTACASSIDAYGFALDLIREGKCDVVAVVGGDIISEAVHAGFNCVYSITNDKPRPFDENRGGFIIGEGAATVILESEDHARKRNARVYAEALGYGGSNSAHHLTSPSNDGVPEALAMERAIRDAEISTSDVDYVLAHGTGTHKNDSTEFKAVRQALDTDSRDRPLHITSIKGSIGHCMGAAGAMSFIAAIKSLNESVIPLTANVKDPDKMFDDEKSNIRLVWKESYPATVNCVLVNSLGFAGNNAVAILKKYL